MKKLSLILFSVLISLSALAQSKTVQVLDPGTLSLEISDAEKNTLTSLTVAGELNGSDILFLIEMAGTTVYHDNETTPGQLHHLDLSGARIVSGGAKYSQWPNYSTVDDQVGPNMFKRTQLQSLVLPSGSTLIGDNAFEECGYLETVSIPASVQSIGNYAFANCHNLKEITLPSGITALKDATFMNCFQLTSLNIPTSVTTIGGNVFNGCVLNSLTLPEHVTSIGYDAFCRSLTELHVKATNVPTAGFRAFNSINTTNCTLYVPEGSANAYRLAEGWKEFAHIIEEAAELPVATNKEVTLTEAGTLATLISEEEAASLCSLKVTGPINALDLRLLRQMAGSGVDYKPVAGNLTCLDLENTHIIADPELYYAIHPYSTQENPIYLTIWSTTMDANEMLPPMVFEGCQLEHIVLPRYLRTIASAFCGCPLKGEIVIPEGVTHIRDYAFQNCESLERIVLPSSLRDVGEEDPFYPLAIGAHAFEGCRSLSEIDIPSGVTVLSESMLEGSGLTSLTVPATIQRIGNRALALSSQLGELRMQSPLPPVAEYGAFEGVDFETCHLVVPEGSEESYRQAEEWCYFFGLNAPESVVLTVQSRETPVQSYDISGQRTTGTISHSICIERGHKIIR